MAGGDDRIIARCARGMSFREAMMYDGLLLWPGDRGKTFYVDTTLGSPTNGGERPDDALDTITDAIALCVSERRDTIFVLDWGTDNGETWPLPMSVAGVTLLGARAGGLAHGSMARIICPDNAAVIAITAHQCRVMNCYLQCPASYDAITFSVNGWTGIFGNLFQTCKDAIGGGVGASTSIGWLSEIAYNFFSQPIADHGIYQFNPSHLSIHDNVFDRVQGDAAIELLSGSYGKVTNNIFGLKDDREGGAITLGRDVLGMVIDGNKANFSRTVMAENPYLANTDVAHDHNCWLLNYRGIVATMPAYS